MSSNLSKLTNNPLNIRYSKANNWIGQDKENPNVRGFVKFASVGYGVRAAILLLLRYRNRGCTTIRKIIDRWAPSSENDTDAYVKFVEDRYRFVFGSLEWKGERSLVELVRIMALYESGSELTYEFIYRIYRLLCYEKRNFEKLADIS